MPLTSHVTRNFRRQYKELPAQVRRDARKAYRLWQADPSHPSLEFKEIELRKGKSVWSVRAAIGWRSIGLIPPEAPGSIVWVWIGSHAEYDKRLELMRRARG